MCCKIIALKLKTDSSFHIKKNREYLHFSPIASKGITSTLRSKTMWCKIDSTLGRETGTAEPGVLGGGGGGKLLSFYG